MDTVRLPEPTKDLERAKRDIFDYGLCVIPEVLTGEALARTRRRFYEAAEWDAQRGLTGDPFELDLDATNRRVWALLNKGWEFVEMAEHPVALELLRSVLGWPMLLCNISGNITGPGGAAGLMHADQSFCPEPWSAAYGANAVWMLDDFTDANGATRIVPGSHRWNRAPREGELEFPDVPIEGAAGTLVVMEARVWHRTGANCTDDEYRGGVLGWYTLPIYRTQENCFLSLNPNVRQSASDTLLELLAYRTQGFGLVNGSSPA